MAGEPGDVELGAPGPKMPAADGVEPGRGTLILVFGVLGLVVCFIFAIFAWVWGNRDLAKMKAGTMDAAGEQHTSWGRLLGIISVVWHIVVAVVLTIWLLVNGPTIAERFYGA